ncbi:MAG: oligosaccharide flippase family protein [Mariprofundaceae bacterium]|nr:oligosaccharide flippase family protein [Mariprofundaceae bacterium]
MEKKQQGLFYQTFHAAAWHSISFVLVRLVSMIRTMILARLLVPEHFGQISIVLIVIESLWAFSNIGFQSAVVQRKQLSDLFLQTAWLLVAVRGVLLAVICWFSAPYAADFFHVAVLEGLLHWAALIPLLQGLESMAMSLWQRELEFRKRAWIEFGREAVVTTTAVLIALILWNDARAMVAGLIAGALFHLIMPYFMHSFRPLLRFNWSLCSELWSFGSHLLVSGLLTFAIASLDDVVIGRLLGMEQLGYYTVAFTLASLLTIQIVQLAHRVLFPAFSSIQEDVVKLTEAVMFALTVAVVLLSMVVGGGLAFPEGILRIIYGESWLAAALPLTLLLCSGWFRGITQVFGSVLLARGMTARLHLIRWAEFILFATMIIPAVRNMGVSGAALTLLAVYFLGTLLMIASVSKDLAVSYTRFLSVIISGVVPAIIAYLGVYLAARWSPEVWGVTLVREIGLVLIYLILFGALLAVTHRGFIGSVRSRLSRGKLA